jgi:hypothetical protein
MTIRLIPVSEPFPARVRGQVIEAGVGVRTLLVGGFTTKIACPTGSLRVLVYPSRVDVSTAG